MLFSARACWDCADPCLADACHFSSAFPFRPVTLIAGGGRIVSLEQKGGGSGGFSAAFPYGNPALPQSRGPRATFTPHPPTPRPFSMSPSGRLKKKKKKKRGGTERRGGSGGGSQPPPSAAQMMPQPLGGAAAAGRRRAPGKSRAGPPRRPQRAAAAGAAERSATERSAAAASPRTAAAAEPRGAGAPPRLQETSRFPVGASRCSLAGNFGRLMKYRIMFLPNRAAGS